jgi:ribonuclease III
MVRWLSSVSRVFESSDKKSLRKTLRNLLGLNPKNLALYQLSLTHRSASIKLPNGVRMSNERLEFLGDAVLGAAVGALLFKKFPYEDEGFLTQARSKIVSRKNLNQLSRKLGLPDLLIKNTSTKQISSIPGDALEAIIGAMFLDQGFPRTERFINQHLIGTHLNLEELLESDDNYKSRLIEYCQKEKIDFKFEMEKEDDENVRSRFTVSVVIGSKSVGRGKGQSKKSAEQEAAKRACDKLSEQGVDI